MTVEPACKGDERLNGAISNGAELRRFVRSRFRGNVVRIDGLERVCSGLDISAGGVCVVSTERMDVGQPIVLAFLSRCISIKGKVRHTSPCPFGLWRVGITFDREEHELAEVVLAAS